jgi:RND family efflux transporter MFP subunit
MRWRTLALAALTLGAAGGGAAYYFLRPPVVTVSLASYAPVSEVVYGTGTVEPVRWAKVVPFTRRRIVDLCRCEGQAVKQGQVLARQDDGEEQAALNELNARLAQLERDLDRSDKDLQKGSVSKQQNEQLKTQIQELNYRISAQKERINALVLKAPLDGMVLRRDGEVGEIAGPTDVLFWVGPPTPMQVVAEINEEEIPKIALGQKAYLRNEAFQDQSLTAKVSQITPKGNPESKTFRVYLLLPRDTPLRIGMTTEVNIVYRENPEALVVPTEAIADNSVSIVDGDRTSRVRVSVGVRGSRLVEVISGVPEGAMVVSPARTDLASGTAVRIDLLPEIVTARTGASQVADAKPAVTRGPLGGSRSTAADPGAPPAGASSTTSQGGPDFVADLPAADVDQAISAALSARVLSIVNDARRRSDAAVTGK